MYEMALYIYNPEKPKSRKEGERNDKESSRHAKLRRGRRKEESGVSGRAAKKHKSTDTLSPMMAQATKVNGKKKSKIKNQKSLALDNQRLFPLFPLSHYMKFIPQCCLGNGCTILMITGKSKCFFGGRL